MSKELIAHDEVALKVELLNYLSEDCKITTMFVKNSKGDFDLCLVKFFNDLNKTETLAIGFDSIKKYVNEALHDGHNQMKMLQRLNGVKEWWIV